MHNKFIRLSKYRISFLMKQIKNISFKGDQEVIASVPDHTLTPRGSGSSLSSSDEELNEPAQNTIVNSVLNSNNVKISNSTSNVYNAPVVINHIYQQHGNVEQLCTETATASENTFSKTFFKKVLQLYSTRCCISVLILLVIIVVFVISIVIWLVNADTNRPLPLDPDWRIVSRIEWKVKPPKTTPRPLQIKPPAILIIIHTVTTLCYTLEQCIMLVQRMQTNDMGKIHNFTDISYNFLVGGDGLVYDGRGWSFEGAHTISFNSRSIGIALIGTFEKEEPTKLQLRATQMLMEYGVENGYISFDYKLFGHRQCKDTQSPGDVLYGIVKTWKHWSPVCQ